MPNTYELDLEFLLSVKETATAVVRKVENLTKVHNDSFVVEMVSITSLLLYYRDELLAVANRELYDKGILWRIDWLSFQPWKNPTEAKIVLAVQPWGLLELVNGV